MATANPLEDQISCSICFDIYKQPHLLNTCLHTFCLDCIHQLEKRGIITCPECREVTHKKDIRRDFKSQGFIDAFRAQNEDIAQAQNIGSTTCGMCQDETNPVKFYCEECEYFLCSPCHVLHQRSKACKSHILKSVAEIFKVSESELKSVVNDLEKHVVSVDKTLSDVTSNLTEVNRQEIQQLKDVNKYTQDAIRHLKRNEKLIEKIIKDANATLISHLNMQKEILTKGKQELLDKIAFVNDLIKSQDFLTLIETAQSVKENMVETLKQIKSSLPDVCSKMKSPVHLTKGENWDVEGCIDVKIDDITQISTIFKPLLKICYSELHKNKYKHEHSTTLSFWPQKLQEINDEIWCCGNNQIDIYNQKCQQVKQITLEKIGCICSLSQTHKNDIIVASESGCHLIDVSGQYKTQIAKGGFSDVCMYNNHIYALEYHKTKITVFKYINEKLKSMTNIKLSYNNGNTWDKMCVCEAGMYISSHKNSCIYIYSLQGQLQQQIQCTGGLILCGVDGNMNILAVDNSNQKIKVSDKSGKWQDINIFEDINKPIFTVLDTSGALWQACEGLFYGGNLTKYVKMHN